MAHTEVPRVSPLLACVWLHLLSGCEANGFQFSGAGPVQVNRACAAGMTSTDDGRGCDAILPPGDCPPGTMARLGQTGCQPVGWTTCPSGFVREVSGWSCQAERPALPCTGATRQALGARSCQPVGDCAAPFPPADATLFVDDSYATVDATHFRTVGAALSAAAPGAVIAVAEGRYAESLAPQQPVRLVGQCPARVTLVGPGSGPGLIASGVTGVVVEGFTVTNHLWGAVAVAGGQLTLRNMVFDGNRKVGVLSDGSTVNLVDSVVRGTLPHQGQLGVGVVAENGTLSATGCEFTSNTEVELVAGGSSQVHLEASLVHRTVVGSAGYARLLHLERGASVQVERSECSHSQGTAILVRGSSLSMTDSVVSDVLPNAGVAGAGFVVTEGGTVDLRRVGIMDVRGIGYDARSTSALVMEDSSVLRTTQPPTSFGVGLSVAAARLQLRRSAFVGNIVAGVHLREGAQALVEDSLFRDTVATPELDGRGLNAEYSNLTLVSSSAVANHGYGLIVQGGSTFISRTAVLETGSRVGFSGGTGMHFQQAEVLIEESAVSGSPEIGITVYGGTMTISQSVVRDGKLTYFNRYGDGIVALEDAQVDLFDTDLRTAKGVGLVCSHSSVRVHGGTFVGNAVALGAQDGSTVSVAPTPAPLAMDLQLIISERTAFIDNTAKLSSGSVLLPTIRLPLP